MRFIFIHRESECFPITALCRVLRVSCSGYHAWLSRVPCARKVEDQRLAVEITAVFMRSRKTYGSPRIYVDLASRGICVGRNRIARIMQILGLCAREKRSFKCTTDSRMTQRIAPNVLARSFTAAAPNRKWVTDVTGMYRAVIDLFSRRIVGHAMSEKGDCWDNAVAESFFSTLEWELLRKRSFATHGQARRIVSTYIDQFFNPIRRHSTNGYFSPIEFELRHGHKCHPCARYEVLPMWADVQG